MRAAPASTPEAGGDRTTVCAQPGYPWFYLAVTLGRLADEMFPVAVVLTARFGAGTAVTVQAAMAVAGLAALAGMPALPGGGSDGQPAAGALAGLRHLARVPVLRAVTIATTITLFGQGILPLALPLLTAELDRAASRPRLPVGCSHV